MTHRAVLILSVALIAGLCPSLSAAEKPRVVVMTDIENEPDDAMSMVRFLTYANQWDVEALIATTSVHQRDKTAGWRIRQIVEAYGKVRDNLEKHEPGYPTADYLLSVIREGRSAYGMAAVGSGMGYRRVIVTVDPSAAIGGAPQIGWGPAVVQQTPEWYASPAARAMADSVLLYQSPLGAWPKNTDLTRPRAAAVTAGEAAADPNGNTIDNDATTLPMEFLALMVHATGDGRYRAAFERGVDYLLDAQYPNGGWPQYFPLREGYYSRITFNDNAMVRVLTLLRDAAAGRPPYAFVDAERRRKAGAAVARGIDVILRTQVKQGGKLTAWCAQHDERTLEPAWARNYEPPTLSGSESVGIVRFLMDIDKPTPAIVAAVEGAVAWLTSVAIGGLRYEEFAAADGSRDRRVVADPAGSPLWARFYELGTNRPVFTGRDKVIRYVFGEIEQERRSGYAYYGTWPARLLGTDYPRWLAGLKGR